MKKKTGWRYAYGFTLAVVMLWALTVIVFHSICILNNITVTHIGLYPLIVVFDWVFWGSVCIFIAHLFTAIKNKHTEKRQWIVSFSSLVVLTSVLIIVWMTPY